MKKQGKEEQGHETTTYARKVIKHKYAQKISRTSFYCS